MAKITYGNKVALNVNSDIADINKCSASDLNEIKDVVNTNDDNMGLLSNLNTTNKSNLVEAINEAKLENYSTTEIVIGKWIDNKPLYRKVLNIGSHNWNEADQILAHNISNLGVVIKSQWIGFYNYRWYYTWDDLTANNITVNSTDVIISCTSSGTGVTFPQNYIILEYTKTTN